MISLEKWKILTPLQNLPKIVGDLGQLIVGIGFKKLPKVQKIAKSGNTANVKIFFIFWASFQTSLLGDKVSEKLGQKLHFLKNGSSLASFIFVFSIIKQTVQFSYNKIML